MKFGEIIDGIVTILFISFLFHTCEARSNTMDYCLKELKRLKPVCGTHKIENPNRPTEKDKKVIECRVKILVKCLDRK